MICATSKFQQVSLASWSHHLLRAYPPGVNSLVVALAQILFRQFETILQSVIHSTEWDVEPSKESELRKF